MTRQELVELRDRIAERYKVQLSNRGPFGLLDTAGYVVNDILAIIDEAVESDVPCRVCGGDGFTAEHDPSPWAHDENGECLGSCPVQVQCDRCIGTGKEPAASDARELALELAAGMWEPDTLYVGARNKWLTNAATTIESFASDRERKVREETARKCAEAAIAWYRSGQLIPAHTESFSIKTLRAAIMEAARE